MPGVYELADEEKRVIYIGQSARDVPGRIRQHLSRAGCVRERAAFWRYQFSRVPQSEEADLLAAYHEAHGRQPGGAAAAGHAAPVRGKEPVKTAPSRHRYRGVQRERPVLIATL